MANTEDVLIPTAEPTTENVNIVPQKNWRKWSDNARRVFNAMMASSANMSVMTHPAAPTMADEHWKTIRWNMAWLAADAVDVKI
jgi:hypothetical protein